MNKKTLIPNEFYDFLSIFSFIGFIGITSKFLFDITWIENNGTGILLLFSGFAFLIIGKAFTFKKWIKDGIQQNEFSLLLSLVFGLSSLIVGFLLLVGINIPLIYSGYIGFISLIPAIYTAIDYYIKNTKRK